MNLGPFALVIGAAAEGTGNVSQLIVIALVLAAVLAVGWLVLRAMRRRSRRLREGEDAAAPVAHKGLTAAEAEPEAEAELAVPVEPEALPVAPEKIPEPVEPVEAEVAKPVAEVRELFKIPPSATMRQGLAKTKQEGFIARLGGIFKGKQIDSALLEQVEEVLLTSDIGVRTSQKLIDGMREALSRKELADSQAVWGYLRQRSRQMLDATLGGVRSDPVNVKEGPEVFMMVGVNGTGKTTTIGKLAARYKAEGRKILLVAGDTFRAAAVDQLLIWARRVDVDVHTGAEEADPASVIFDALGRGQEEGHDLVIVDTAGRLHTKVNLMEELKKVTRVIHKTRPGAPHEIWLVLDATMGQNAIQQAKIFKEAVNITGIVLTKLDGTARGGVVLGIADELGLPIRYVGIGERLQDLRPFDAGEFVDALFAEETN